LEQKYFSQERAELKPFVPQDVHRVLDVGCGEAAFSAGLRMDRPELEIWGVEPSTVPAKVAAGRLNRVVPGLFSPELALPEGHFDLLMFNDSLEHMPDEVAALKLAHRLIRPGGYLMCSVPNVRYFENVRHLLVDADWRYEDSGIRDRTHLRFFTKTSIQRVVRECGFEVLRCEGVNSHWWTGLKLGLLKLVFGRHMEDMRWWQIVVVARRRNGEVQA
jgi:SAM-dependent methyltransferase